MRIKLQIVAAGLLSAFLLGLGVPLLSQTSTSAGGAFQPIQDYTVGGAWTWRGQLSPWIVAGATEDAFETTFTFAEPTADAVIGVPEGSTFTLGDQTAVYAQGPAVADAINTQFFIADRAYTVTDIDVSWAVAESTGAMAVQVQRLQGTEAIASGDDLLASTIDATATANTVTAGTLTTTTAFLDLAAGDRLAVELTATPNEVTNIIVTVGLIPN